MTTGALSDEGRGEPSVARRDWSATFYGNATCAGTQKSRSPYMLKLSAPN